MLSSSDSFNVHRGGKNMMEKITIIERLEFVAAHGETSTALRLWKSQMKKLENEGFLITVIQETERKGEYYCDISWKNPTTNKGDSQKLLQYTINCLNNNVSDEQRIDTPYDVDISVDSSVMPIPYGMDI